MGVPDDVFAALYDLSGPTAALAEEACAHAGIRARHFDGVTSLPSPASLIVTELCPSERRVPRRVLEVARSSGRQASLLVLSTQKLVRPHVTVQRARMAMVGPPHSVGQLSSRIRVLLAGTIAPPGGGPAPRREHLAERWWLSSFGPSDAGPGVLVQPADAAGMTAVLFATECEARGRILEEVVALLAREQGDEARRTRLAQVAGPSAVVHLSAAGDRWLFYAPSPRYSLWIHSPQRLPTRADLGAGAPLRSARSMIAAPGDVVLALSAALPAAEATKRDLWRALEDGGPAAVDVVVGAAGLAAAGVAVEAH